MTSTEDLLRDALHDLAPGAPADERAFAGIGRAITHRRRRRAQVRMAAVAAVAVAALGTAALVGGRPDETGTMGQPDGTTTPDDGNEPSASIEPDDGNGDGAAGDVTQIGPDATFVLPEGWEISNPNTGTEEPGTVEPGAEPPQYTSLCLSRPSEAAKPGCALEILHGDVPGEESSGPYDPDTGWSWHHGNDVVVCPGSTNYNDILQPVDGNYDPVESSTAKVGGRDALYSRWAVECRLSGQAFNPQAWYLADEQLLIIDVAGQPETEAILDSFTFDDEAG